MASAWLLHGCLHGRCSVDRVMGVHGVRGIGACGGSRVVRASVRLTATSSGFCGTWRNGRNGG
uniref:Uncharacterized protein n=1 Tax=Oryza nivara TaxID=4536 RepID=A0A0E0INV2_ORYNI